MNGLMMDFQLTLPTILKRAETYFPHQEIVTRMPDRSFHRYTFADFGKRARQLAVALKGVGLEPGDRVATLCWNHYQHLEAYLGIPCGGFVLHTLNLRLHPNDLGYIATHAGDKALIVDKSLLPLWEQFADKTPIEHVFVVEDSYEELLAGADPDAYEDPQLDEDTAAAMCYTSGTTGMPKGVLYSHRSAVLHTLGQALVAPLGLHVTEAETLLPVVPMFHANAWGYPYTCLMVGTKIVFPGPFLDPETLLDDFEQEGVTITAGVPTIWMGILGMLDAEPNRWNLDKLKYMLVGGSAAPRAMIAGFRQRHGKTVVHGWGMTETSPLATTSDYVGDFRTADEETQLDVVAMQGLPLPFVELRAMGDDGKEIPWDGEAMGELEVRGPWVAVRLLRHARAGRALDRGRLVQDRRHRLVPPEGLRDDQGPLEGRDQVRRRVDLLGRPRERADGAPGDRRGGRDRDPAREVGRAAAGRLRLPRGQDRDRRRAARVPRPELRQVLAPGRVRVRRRDPEDRGGQVPQDRAAGAVREPTGFPVVEIRGKTFIVTGGRSGLGEATAAMLEREGATAVIADLPETDVTDADAVQALVESCSELHGAVNCAGIGGGARVVGFPLDRFRKIVEVNLIGTFNVLSLAAAKLAENEPDEEGTRGVIVNTASNAAFDGQIGQAAYSASKAGVAGMTLPVARDLASKGIRVVTIAPGPADTPMLGPMREDIRESLVSQIPFPKRLGRAEDFAALVKHIVENEYLNGEVIRLDGALRMGPR